MVQYQCNQCYKYFSLKCDYDRHLARKRPCKPNRNKDIRPKTYDCDCCHQKFSRKDHFNKHICIPTDKSVANTAVSTCKSTNKIIKGSYNCNIYGGDNNSKNIYINYNLAPFGKESMDCLSLDEKINILNSKNILQSIIISINFNPTKFNNHNVYYGDVKNGYGMVYDGKSWRKERISSILNTLCDTRHKNLNDIYDEIKFYLPPQDKTQIRRVLDSVDCLIYPRLRIDFVNRENFHSHTKIDMVNNSKLGKTAMDNTNNCAYYDTALAKLAEEPKFIGKPKYTVAEMQREINLNHRLKKFAVYSLKILYTNDLVAYTDFDNILAFIDVEPDNSHLRAVIHVIDNAICHNTSANLDIINNEIEYRDQVADYMGFRC